METTTLAAELAEAIVAAEAAATALAEARRSSADEDAIEVMRLRCIEAEDAVSALTR
jgi:hypothetical protein